MHIDLPTYLAIVLCLNGVEGCYIMGTDSGECTTQTLDQVWRETYMPYCGPHVPYPVCIPQYQTLPASREFPDGRWFNHTVLHKDTWVYENSEAYMKLRIELELNRTLMRANTNEYGDKGGIQRRFYHKPDCRNAFKSYFCWINFPRCNPERDLTLPTCRSACVNFFKTCGYELGLWRCGPSKYFNGYVPEQPTVDGLGNATYLRDYFPGQPFRENKYTKDGNEEAICTPAILGSARSSFYSSNTVMISTAVVIFISLLFVVF